jgi:predicted CXXCH cytochrome family protein
VLLPLLALLAGTAHAAIEGSPHDLIAQGYDVVKASVLQERCSRCHIPASPALMDFLPDVPPVLAGAFEASSLGCFSCHDGTTIVSPNVDASRTAFHPASHGNDLTGYEGLQSEVAGLPHISGKRMECVTCHDPHDDGHRPFLRADLAELCLLCHSKYVEYGLGTENRTGSHILAPDPLGDLRKDAPLEMSGAFRTAFPSYYPLERGRESGGWHWDLGGHLSEGRTGAIGCSTCHAVHGNESAPPAAGLLAVAPVNDVANLFCEGCHAGERGDGQPAPPRPNPGGTKTARTYHPADNDLSNGTERTLEIREPSGWPFGGGIPRRLLCTTCHAAHGAWVETPLLRPPQLATGFCEECHETLPDYHHTVGALPETGCASRVPAPPYGKVRDLGCAVCHRAHNAGFDKKREGDYVPLLRDSLESGAICALCHPAANPTCSKDPDYTASHFLGDPALPETYEDKVPPERTEAWPESGLASSYGGERDQDVTCLSCHAFKKGSLLSGDDGKARFLLARSGNPVEWEDGREATYLCVGCHSVDPVTGQAKGHTHPTMKANMAALGREAAAPITATPSGHVNCDSCHRPHAAATASGRYILEAARGQNTDPLAIQPQIDFTGVCHGCHDRGKY